MWMSQSVSALSIVVLAFLAFIVLVSSEKVKFKKLSTCKGSETKGDYCLLKVLDARVTQYAYGRLSALCKQQNMERKSKKKLQKYLERHTVPVVIGPSTNDRDRSDHHEHGATANAFYLLDHHHLLRALLDADIPVAKKDRFVIASVQENWSNNFDRNEHGMKQFWDKMVQGHYAWLYDQYRRQIYVNSSTFLDTLPQTVEDLKNDPFRTLSYVLRNKGTFGKDDSAYFIEFVWANFMRNHFTSFPPYNDLNVSNELQILHNIIEDSIQLALSSKSEHLPGYGKGEKKDIDCDMLAEL